MIVRGILSCGCVFHREAEGFSVPDRTELAGDRKLVAVGDTLWCQNHYAEAELLELDPLGEATGGAAA